MKRVRSSLIPENECEVAWLPVGERKGRRGELGTYLREGELVPGDHK